MAAAIGIGPMHGQVTLMHQPQMSGNQPYVKTGYLLIPANRSGDPSAFPCPSTSARPPPLCERPWSARGSAHSRRRRGLLPHRHRRGLGQCVRLVGVTSRTSNSRPERLAVVELNEVIARLMLPAATSLASTRRCPMRTTTPSPLALLRASETESGVRLLA